ncbi:cytochrome P450 2J1-like [Pseudoliparis swirei]|uniref:cytochrome P450 2J1-like n=1 Tax=Pseudoliparis swirei TaxID=2059687 RepID=UPI0024BDD882|nr:cytochrome P450 2J1-like [Pseudoliparis swirei]
MDSICSVFGSLINWDVKSLLFFTVVFILTADYIKNRRPGSFPPGPRAFPIVGNLFTLDYTRTHESMTQLSERYGDVYSLRMGQLWFVVLNRFEVLREALVDQGDGLADRPDLPLQQEISQGLGVLFSNGNLWKQKRCFAISTLKHFGFGKKSLEPNILEEFSYCAKEFKSHKAKVQAEIDEVIGTSRQPSMEDRADLPYTEAVIHEIQRMANIGPLSLPHATTREIHLGGSTIPKGVTVIPNLNSVLFDKNEWETPDTFNPGHFLNQEGKFVKRAAFLPFSAGKRVCLGENLARMELFLFFTSLMQHFIISMPAGEKPVMGYCFGITLAPLPYEVCLTSR